MTQPWLQCLRRLMRLGRFWGVGAAGLLLLSISSVSWAQLASVVDAQGQYQYNSNVFDLQRGFASGPNDYQRADRYYAYGAGVNLSDQLSQQTVYLKGTLTQYDYDHFTTLSHYEYNGDGGIRWKLGDDWSGTFDVTRSRTMVPFVEFVSLAMVISTDQRETATVDYQFIPTWHFQADGYTDRNQEPLPGEPNEYLIDSGGDASVRFMGGGGISGGITGGYQHGGYTNAIAFFSPSYKQWTEGVVAAYRPSGPGGRSTIDFGIGGTSRVSPYGGDNLSGWTGHLDYSNAVTGKTTLQLALLRNISSYITHAGSEIDSSAAISARYQATYKSAFNVGYTLLYSVFPDEGFLANSARNDHLQFVTLTVTYNALQWLMIQPYMDYQTRKSNLYGANFNSSIFGVMFSINWMNRAAAGPAMAPALATGIGAAGAPVGLPAGVP